MNFVYVKSVLAGAALSVLLTGCAARKSEGGKTGERAQTNTATPVPAVNTVSEETRRSPQPESPPTASRYDNQMGVAELRKYLDEVKDIERRSRRLVALRGGGNWERSAAECNRLAQELEPRAQAISDLSNSMLSPAGTEIASAANSLRLCISCVEDDDETDCRDAREYIRNAERELRKEARGR